MKRPPEPFRFTLVTKRTTLDGADIVCAAASLQFPLYLLRNESLLSSIPVTSAQDGVSLVTTSPFSVTSEEGDVNAHNPIVIEHDTAATSKTSILDCNGLPDPLIQLDSVMHLDMTFPPRAPYGQYSPSPWQSEVLQQMTQSRELRGHGIGLVIMATAAGKTILSILDVERDIQSFSSPNFRVLYLVHTRAIRDTAALKYGQHFHKYGAGSISVITGSPPPTQARFVFTTFASFGYVKEQMDTFTHAVVDEVHHAVAPSFRIAVECILSGKKLRYLLGMTATLIHRHDPTGTGLSRLFRDTIYIDFPWTTAKELGAFPEVEYVEALSTLEGGRDVVTYDQTLRKFKEVLCLGRGLGSFLRDLDKSLFALSMIRTEDVRKRLSSSLVTDQLLRYLRAREQASLPEKRRIIIFASGCGEASEIATLLCTHGIKAAAAHYKLAKAADNFKLFTDGEIQALVTVQMATEGYDLAGIDCVVMARASESELQFVQQMGRGLRRDPLFPNKEVTILDLALNLRRRWKRLRTELPEHAVCRQILQFWRVQNFVGHIIN